MLRRTSSDRAVSSRRPEQGSLRRQRGAAPRSLSRLLLQLLAATGILPVHAADPVSLPVNATVTSGSASIVQSPGSMRVHQSSERLVANWDSFSIGSKAAVEFVQPSSQAVALNRVVGASPSELLGRLSANGRIFLVNPNGILFGGGARVDVGGIVASTLSLSDADFLAGRYRFENGSTAGAVINQGTITARDGGHVALLGAQVRNQGLITARAGQVALGAGERMSLDFHGDGLVSLSVDQALLGALVENSGRVGADGGLVLMSARAAGALPGMVLNQSGIVEARSIQERDGRVYLDNGSGDAHISGVIDVSGRNAGEHGGSVTVLGQRIGLLPGAVIDASGATGGGAVLVGGNWQGGGSEAHAHSVVLAPGASIAADALGSGGGGRVVLWSTGYTGFEGRITARGVSAGGEVETSSLGNLQASGLVDAAASAGRAGKWLLDPADITITGTTANGSFGGGNPDIFTPAAGTASVNAATINASLNSGTDVTVQTGGAAGGNGDITVQSAISKTAGGDATLRLLADRNIIVSSATGISSSSGKLNVLLNSRVQDGAIGRISVGSAINSNGGDISLVGGSGGTGHAVGNAGNAGVILAAALNAGGGNVTIRGQGNAVGTSTGGILSSAAISTSGLGAIALHGIGGDGGTVASGISLDNGASFATALGDITLVGNAIDTTGTANGVYLLGSGTRAFTSAGGNISLNGSSSSAGSGIMLNAAAAFTTAGGGAITLRGTGGNGQGGITATRSLAFSTGAGDIAIAGSGNGLGTDFGGSGSTFSASSNGGDISVSGTSTGASSGLKVDPGYGRFDVSTTAGGIALTGVSASGRGYFQNGGIVSLTAGGDISVSGASSANAGIHLGGIGAVFNAAVTGNGNVSIAGSGGGANSGVLVDAANATIASAGTGAISITGQAGSGSAASVRGIGLNPGSGVTRIYSTGGGSIVMTGRAPGAAAVAISLNNACIGTDCAGAGNTRDVTLSADSMSFSGSSRVTGNGMLRLQPQSAGGTTGIGGGAGMLALGSGLFSGAGRVFQPGFSGITIGSATAGDINVGLGGLSFSDPGPLDLFLTSGADIMVQAGGAGIAASGSQAADLTLTARAGDGGAGRIEIGSAIRTNGGDLALVGGSTNGYAIGDGAMAGVAIHAMLDAGGGDILVKGQGGASGTANTGVLVASDLVSAGSGSITLAGIGGGPGGESHGVRISGAVRRIEAGSGVSIGGTGSGGGSGILVDAAEARILSRNGGDLTLSGRAGAGGSALDVATACLGYDCGAGGNTRNVTLSAEQGAMRVGRIRAAGDVSAYNDGGGAADTLRFEGAVNAGGQLEARTAEGNLVVAAGASLAAAGAAANALRLGAGTGHGAGDTGGGNVVIDGSIAAPASRAMVWTGSIAGSGGAGLAALAPFGSQRFRYGRSWGDAASAAGVMVQYREQPLLTLALAGSGRVYDGAGLDNAAFSRNAASYTVSGMQNGDTLAGTGLAGSLAFDGSESTEVRNAGVYSVGAGSIESLAGYAVSFEPHPYTVARRPITLVLPTLGKLPGQTDPVFDASRARIAGGSLAPGDTLQSLLGTSVIRAAGENPGLYSYRVDTSAAGNYALSMAEGWFAIQAPAPDSLVADFTTTAVRRNPGAEDCLDSLTPAADRPPSFPSCR